MLHGATSLLNMVATLLKGPVTITIRALKVGHQPDKFGGHTCCNRDMILVCHVILQDQVSKVSSHFMGESC